MSRERRRQNMLRAGTARTSEKQMSESNRWSRIAVAALFVVGCDPSPAKPPGGSGGASGTGGSAGQVGTIHEMRPVLLSANHYQVPWLGGGAGAAGQAGGGSGGKSGGTGGTTAQGGSAGQGGTGGAPVFVCIPTSTPGTPPAIAVCGDGFLGGAEQCDDGNKLDGDACSATCTVTPGLVAQRAASVPPSALSLPSRELQLGRHPLGVGCNTVGVAFVDRTSTPAALKLATYSSRGGAQGVLTFGNANVDRPNPSLAALPDDSFVAAWTDFDSDELGVQLSRIAPASSTPSTPIVANLSQAFSQRAPDVVFDGSQLVVAWVDDSDPVNGPDLRYRTFAADLSPTSGDLTLSATTAVEDDVTLAATKGAWAAAWRSGSGGQETVEIQSGATRWFVGPFTPSGTEDRPALVFLDASHLALAFTEGSDPTLTGVANVPRLHGAILDAAYPGNVESFSIPQTVAPWANVPTLSQTEPTLTAFADHLVLGWRTSLVNGNAAGDELWTRELKWAPGAGNTLVVDTTSPDIPMISAEARRVGDQAQPALLSSPLWPPRSLVSTWQDSGKTFGSVSGQTDVALQFSQIQSTCTGVTLGSNQPASYNTTGQYAVSGETIVFTANGACNGAPQYRFVMQRPDGVWIATQEWSSANTFSWNTTGLTMGYWNIQVWVRDQPGGDYQAYTGKQILLTDAAACTSAAVVSDHTTGYGVTGDTVTWKASSTCAGYVRYKFWLLAPGAGSYTVGQDWSANDTFVWNTSALPIGYWTLIVWASDSTFFTNSYQAYGSSSFILNNYAACTAATLVSDDADYYALPGQAVHWTATSTCAGPAEYRFVFDNPSGVWTQMQDWSSNNTFTWNTTGQPVGFWNMQVWVRDAPFYNAAQTYGAATFTLNTSPACTSMTSTATPNTVVSGTLVTFKNVAATCTTPEYAIYHYPPGGGSELIPYSPANANYVWNSTGAAPGYHVFTTYSRTVGSTMFYQAYNSTSVFVSVP